jgi:two-component system sensor histidine kinase/response regulator
MGGRMWVESEVAKGSTFHFTASFQRGLATASNQEKIAGQTLAGLEILVADDNAINRNILAEMLNNWRMNAVFAEDGAGALRAMETARAAGRAFPIVLLDANMPGLDGFVVAKRILRNPSLAGSVILMLSAENHLTDAGRCHDLGVKVFLTKPIGQSELLDAILSVLGVSIAEERLITIPAPVREAPQGRPLNVLVAEDNPVNQKLTVRLLEKAGHHLTLAATGNEAVAAWENAASPGFDLVLMDIQMPEMDGMEATAAIREREKLTGKRIPIVAMTAHAMRGDKERYLKGGMDGYVSKPINANALFTEIERCLAVPWENAAKTTDSQEQCEHLDRASLFDRVEGDQELLLEIINLFMEDAPRLLAAMHAALEHADMSLLERSAHSMKGAASNLSAHVTVAAAEQLEKNAGCGDMKASKLSLANLEEAVRRLLPGLAEMCQRVSK